MSYLSSFWASEFIRAFGWTLLHSLWQGAAILILAIVTVMFLRNSSPKSRYAVLSGFLAFIPVTFIITFFLIYQPEQSLPWTPSLATGTPSLPTGIPSLTAGTPSLYSSLLSFLDQKTPWMFVIWFAGFMILLIRFSGSLTYLNRLRRIGLAEVSIDSKKVLEKLAKQVGLKVSVRLAESTRVRVPMAVGYLKPMILLPVGLLSSMPAQQIDAILLHELAHIRRRDYLLNLVQSVIEMLFFYHPATWYLSNQIRLEREQICDDIALSIHHDRINYIKALTIMEEMNVKSPVLANSLVGPKKKLLYRVKRLLNPQKINRGFSEGIIGFLLLALIIVAISTNALTYAMAVDENPSRASLAGYNAALPTAYDLSGRESGEKVTNYLPQFFLSARPATSGDQPGEESNLSPVLAFQDPDTVITKSESGKVTVKVIRDTSDNGREQEMKVIVESMDDSDADHKEVYKEEKVIRMNMEGECHDNGQGRVIIIQEGDSMKVISNGKTLVLPKDYDTTIVTEGGFGFYGFGDIPEPLELNMDDEAMQQAMKEYEKAMKEYEYQIRDFDGQEWEMKEQQREMERQMREGQVFVYPPVEPVPPMVWNYGAPELPDRSTEKVIRQELREDGLVEPGRSYIIEISPKEMYINGVKQEKETSKKYRHLVEGLEPGLLDDNGNFKIVF